MIVKCQENDLKSVFEYIGNDYGNCLYIYIDLKKYGLNNKDFNVWYQMNADNEIHAVITEYYKGIQIYSRYNDFVFEEIADFLKDKNASLVFARKETADIIKEYLSGFSEEHGVVGKFMGLKCEPNKDAYSASDKEVSEIVALVAADEDIGKPYGYDSLFDQYTSRREDNFGRNYILRDKETNTIISHAGTYAELPELAVIGGVITAPEYRGKGYSKGNLAALCLELQSENKDVFSFFYVPSAMKMHYGVGFEKYCDWVKLIKEK